MIQTCSLQSGSNGNAIYVEAGDVRLLFDAGITGRQARLRLAEHERDIRDVNALLLSHAHGDHTRGTGPIHRLFHIPVWMTTSTHRIIQRHVGNISGPQYFVAGRTVEFGAVRVHTLPTPHDCLTSVAFIVEFEGRKLGIFTDLGNPFAELQAALAEVDAAYLESNYDPDMLEHGDYPADLKARIRSDAGHISNGEAAELLLRAGTRPQWVALAHLSHHNNLPELALETHRNVLGRDYPLTVASRYRCSEWLTV